MLVDRKYTFKQVALTYDFEPLPKIGEKPQSTTFFVRNIFDGELVRDDLNSGSGKHPEWRAANA